MVFYEQESLTVPETFSYKTYCITLLDPSALIGWRFCPHQSDAAWFNSSYDKGGPQLLFCGSPKALCDPPLCAILPAFAFQR